jgi:hypothetical protein
VSLKKGTQHREGREGFRPAWNTRNALWREKTRARTEIKKKRRWEKGKEGRHVYHFGAI